jgi:hypothetical protein
VKVTHPLMLRAIAASKKKNDSIDAGKIADCLRCDFLPECERRKPNPSLDSPLTVSGLAENTNSIFCEGPRGPEAGNGCPVLRTQGPQPRGTRCELKIDREVGGLSSAPRPPCFTLTRDLHGCRLISSIVAAGNHRAGCATCVLKSRAFDGFLFVRTCTKLAMT